MSSLRKSITGALLLNAVTALTSTSATSNYDSVPNTHSDSPHEWPARTSSDTRNSISDKQEPRAVIDKKRRRKLKKKAQKHNR